MQKTTLLTKNLFHYTIVIAQKSRFGYQSYDVFDLQNMNSADCKAEFRVEKADLPRLADALQIPAVFRCRQRSICDGLEGLCVLLRRTSQSTSRTSFLCSKHIPGLLKDGAYYCYCAYVLRISRYSDFLSVMLTNTGIFLRGLKLSGESRS